VVAVNAVDNLAEGTSEGTEVGTAIAVDPDGDDLTLSLAPVEVAEGEGRFDVDGDGTNAFEINEEGEITVADADDLDFDADIFADLADNEQPSLTFNVVATEDTDQELTGQDQVTIGLFEQPEGANIDIDGNGEVTGLTDGILIARSLIGFGDVDLVSGNVFGDGATRTEANEINTFVDGLEQSSIG
jgi:hypothetical protein